MASGLSGLALCISLILTTHTYTGFLYRIPLPYWMQSGVSTYDHFIHTHLVPLLGAHFTAFFLLSFSFTLAYYVLWLMRRERPEDHFKKIAIPTHAGLPSPVGHRKGADRARFQSNAQRR